jgi:hypothetical protein
MQIDLTVLMNMQSFNCYVKDLDWYAKDLFPFIYM